MLETEHGRAGLGAKQRAILAAAERVFIAQGFRRGRVDAIAAEAAVSKQTIYNHFGDKEALVLAVIQAAQGQGAGTRPILPGDVGPEPADVDAAFVEVGKALIAALLRPDLAALRRMVNVEAPRYPDLRTAWVAGGPLRAFEWMSGFLSGLVDRGDLEIEVPIRAVGQLVALVGTPVQELSMWGTRPVGDDVLDEVARVETATFLRVYGTRPRPLLAGPRLAALTTASWAEPGPPEPATGRLAHHRAILDAAGATFLEAGYDGAGVDAIADRAGVSKQTIYNHFGDKQHLFVAAVQAAQRSAQSNLDPLLLELAGVPRDVEQTLRDCCAGVARLATDPRLTALRNLLMFEIPHHPELRRAWSGGGAGPLARALATYFARLAALGALSVPDPTRPAAELLALVASEARSLAEWGGRGLDEAALEMVTEGAVEFLLSAYGGGRPAGLAGARRIGPASAT
jgi:TetR/AcrR family transcriptional regulator, mexJK operon transcriptional repressor